MKIGSDCFKKEVFEITSVYERNDYEILSISLT
jgi:hypothetical protein